MLRLVVVDGLSTFGTQGWDQSNAAATQREGRRNRARQAGNRSLQTRNWELQAKRCRSCRRSSKCSHGRAGAILGGEEVLRWLQEIGGEAKVLALDHPMFSLWFSFRFFFMFLLYVLVGWPRTDGQTVPRLQWSQERDALEAQNGSANIPNVCWFRCHLWATIRLAKVYNWWFTQCSNPDILVLTIRFCI